MPEYREHPGKPVRREGDAVVMLDAGDCVVWFQLDGGDWEGLSAERLSSDLARVTAVPVFAYGVGLGDEVRLRPDDAAAIGLVRSAGNRTFRVVLPASDVPEPDERWRSLLADLEPRGCWLDVYSPRLVAVSADGEHAAEVEAYLSEREARGELAYEAAT